jgi:hypothetical protein
MRHRLALGNSDAPAGSDTVGARRDSDRRRPSPRNAGAMRAQGCGSLQVIPTRSRCRVCGYAFRFAHRPPFDGGMSARQSSAVPNVRRQPGPPFCLISHVPRRQPPTSCPAPPAPPLGFPSQLSTLHPQLLQRGVDGAGQRCREIQTRLSPNSRVASLVADRQVHFARVPAGSSPARRSPVASLFQLTGPCGSHLSGLLLRPPGHSLRSPSDIWWARLLRAIDALTTSNITGAACRCPNFFIFFRE